MLAIPCKPRAVNGNKFPGVLFPKQRLKWMNYFSTPSAMRRMERLHAILGEDAPTRVGRVVCSQRKHRVTKP